MIQRRYSIGYNRAGLIMDQLEKLGIVGEALGSRPREVMVATIEELEEILNERAETELNTEYNSAEGEIIMDSQNELHSLIGCGVLFVVELVRYLRVANSVLPAEAKKMSTKELTKIRAREVL